MFILFLGLTLGGFTGLIKQKQILTLSPPLNKAKLESFWFKVIFKDLSGPRKMPERGNIIDF